ncbi:hypothetical protein [Hyalangium gracile]|uniref:hypothetical protein n=1 Tax=Hyalangium gracile TaxID=394092 RepID=UPI001CCAE734|nr:hypothetical protein [Hyalangium gracile]
MGITADLVGNVLGKIKSVSAEDMKKIEAMPEELRDLQLTALKLQKEEQAITLISNIMKKMHDANMAIINNMR